MNRKLCIYHGNCADGFGAAWAVKKAMDAAGEACDFHAGVYQDAPPDVSGREVFIVDFSYKRLVLETMAESAKHILVLDHHTSAARDLEPFTWDDGWPLRNVMAYFDMGRSGAMMAWEHFHPGTEPPKLIQYVQDRDLWRFALKHSRAVNACIFSHAYDFPMWDLLANMLENETGFEHVVEQGMAIERKHHKDVAELVAAFRRRMTIAGYDVPVANLPYTLTSDAGHLMAEGEPFAACYWDTAEGRVFSLRSTDDGLDVSKIAERYGGGGHARAAGFRVPHGEGP